MSFATSDFVDLHIHSAFSGDGQYPPKEIFSFAASAGMRAFAIGDHDTVAGIPVSRALARESAIEFIPSIELTTLHHAREVHILGPYIEWSCRSLTAALEEVCRQGEEQARARVSLLQKLDFDITWDELAARCKGAPSSGYIIAGLLLNENNGRHRDRRLEPYISGSLSDRPEIHFYRDFLAVGAPAYVPRRWMSTRDAIDLVSECGGVPILAHPGSANYGASERMIAELTKFGLKGLEVFSSYHDEKAVYHFLNVAQRLNLIATAGSDFHGRSKPHVGFGSVRAVGMETVHTLRDLRDTLRMAKRRG
jgi:predicted metal-dependent phosphoesterase TrpH